tara:strand:- start:1110 stop:4715 length:3606 start_codon:yes stop_codon:yes gene_type:complete
MAQYVDAAQDNYFMDLVEDETFQTDLEKFFTGGRYNYSPEKINKLGVEGLADNFVEHMRFQNMNETTAVKDLMYVKRNYMTPSNQTDPVIINRDNKFNEGKQAFGRLMSAYDVSEGGGTGFWEGAWDYGRAFASSPSTLATVGTMGFGVGTKIAAQLSKKATQLAIRAEVSKLIRKGVSGTAIKETLKKNLGTEALKDGVKTFAFEGTMGAGASYAENETREEVVEGYEYGAGDVIIDATIDGTLGASVGSFFGFLDNKANNRAIDLMYESVKDGEKTRKIALEAANKTISKAKPDLLSESIDDIVQVASLFKAKEEGVKLDKLDEDLVALGDGLRSLVLSSEINQELTTSLSLDTIKGVVGASLDIKKTLKMKPGERISTVLARAIADGKIDTPALETIKNKYNISNEQFSYIFLSDLSRAGKVLQSGSAIKQALLNMDVLSKANVSSITDIEAEEIFKTVGGKVVGTPKKPNIGTKAVEGVVEGARQADSLRIAFMTSQLGTTAANVGTGVFNLGVDISDQFWKNVIRSTVGETMPDGSVRRGWVKGTTSILGGLSFSKAESIALKGLLQEEAPLAFRDLFYETTRSMDFANASSTLPRIGKFFNTLNIATDSVFKEAALYGSLDRKLREQGSSLGEFLAARKDNGAPMRLEDLPEDTLAFAINEAKRFTFQKDFKKDTSLFGAGARNLQKLHHKYPFLISVGLDTPFPRYIANHLEYANDYSIIGTATGGMKKLDEMIGGFNNPDYEGIGGDKSKFFGGDPFKGNLDRGARQLTGAMMVMGATGYAAQKGGLIDFDKLVSDDGGETDLSRMAGPFAINLLTGDLIYRYIAGLPLNPKASFDTVREILGGVPDISEGAFTFEFELIKNISASYKQGEMTENLEKQLGNMVATFTYPQTFAKDVYGQFNFEAAGTPFTRDYYFTDEQSDVSNYGERNYLEDIISSNVFKNQATRFLIDLPIFSYTPSYTRGKEKGFDIKRWTPFNENPVSSWNPITKSFGAVQEPPSSAIQKEMTLLGLKGWKEYRATRKDISPMVAYFAEYTMSQTMSPKWEVWKRSYDIGTNNPMYERGTTYDSLGDDYQKKRIILQDFIKVEIANNIEVGKKVLDDASTNPKTRNKYAGYIRNIYAMKKAEYEASGKNLDQVLSAFPERFKGFNNAKDFLENSGSVSEELNRRQTILEFIKTHEKQSLGLKEEAKKF